MAEYTGPATDNGAEVVANMDGHIVPDTYATGMDDSKMGNAHEKKVHNDIYRRFGQDEPEGYNC